MKQYTFDDWINSDWLLYRELCFNGSPVRNDSQKYLSLVSKGTMTYETLNKIQDAQSKAFQMIIDTTIEFEKIKYKRLINQTPDPKLKIESDIEHIRKFFSQNQKVYDEVVYPVMSRGIKKGATFITAKQYLDVVSNNEKKHAFFEITNDSESENINIDWPFSHEWIYCITEVNIVWLQFLEYELKQFNNKNSKYKAIDNIDDDTKDEIFDENLLSDIHTAFDEEIWEKISKVEFLESFYGKSNTIQIKKGNQAKFCFLLGQIENNRNKEVCPNMAQWVELNFGIPECSYKNTKKDTKTGLRINIESKILNILNRYDLK